MNVAVLVRMPKRTYDTLKAVKAMTDVPVNAQIIRAIDASLQPKKKARK